jgi:CheY-like chemotaxis protein
MLVSSSLAFIKHVAGIMGEHGFECAFFEEPDKAIQLAQEVCFDLVLLEYIGAEPTQLLLQELRDQQSACGGAPVIVVANPSNEQEARKLMNHGVQQVVNPFVDEPSFRKWILNPYAAEPVPSEPMLPVCALVRIKGCELDLPGSLVAQTSAISSNQMLIRLGKPVPIGRQFSFCFEASSLPRRLHGKAEVTRQSGHERSRNREITAQLLGFCRDDDEGLFRSFIENQPQQQES